MLKGILFFSSFLLLSYTAHAQVIKGKILSPQTHAIYYPSDTLSIILRKTQNSDPSHLVISKAASLYLDTLIKDSDFKWFIQEGMPKGEYTLSVNTLGQKDQLTFIISENNLLQYQYKWKNINTNANFTPRDGAGLLKFKDKFWLLGGWNAFGWPPCNSEVYSSKDGINWDFQTLAPWEGRHMVGWIVFKDALWVIGGDNNNGQYITDIWKSHDGLSWERVANNLPFLRRVLHMVTTTQDKILIMGGEEIATFPWLEGDKKYGDIWSSVDGINWTKEKELAEFGHRGMILGDFRFKDSLWVIGGGQYSPRVYKNDVWNSADGINWNQAKYAAPFAPRQYHSVNSFDNKIWVSGGFNNNISGNLNDVWYSEDGRNWNELPGTPWSIRHAHSVVADDDGILLLGGPMWMSDVWKLYRQIDKVIISETTDTIYAQKGFLKELYTSNNKGFKYKWYKDENPYKTGNRVIVSDFGTYQLHVTDIFQKEVISKEIVINQLNFNISPDTVKIVQGEKLEINNLIYPKLLNTRDSISIRLFDNSGNELNSSIQESKEIILQVSFIKNITLLDTIFVKVLTPSIKLSQDTLLSQQEVIKAFTDYLPGYKYQWFKENAIIPHSDSSSINIAGTGNYQFKIFKNGKYIYTTKASEIDVYNFSLNLPPTVEIFKGDELQVKAPAHEQLQYEWLHNEAVVASGENLHQLTVKAAGEYKLAVGRKGVNDKFVVDSLAITVITPKLYFAGDTLLIPGEPLQVSTDYLGGYEYKWYRGDDLVADSLGKKAITIWQAGEYYLEIYRANKLVHTTRSFTVSIRSFALNLPAKIELFEKDEVKLEAAQHEQLIYKWQLDGQEKERGPGKNTIQIKGPGSYRLSVSRVAGNESYRIDSVEVIFTKPQLTILGDTLLIPGEELRAQVKSLPGYTYQWYKDEALLARTTNVLDIAQAGIYQVKTLKGNTELYASKKFQVAIRNFSLNLPPTVEIFKGDELQVKAPAHEQLQYEWLHNEAVVASGENLHQLTVKAAGEYKLAVGRKGVNDKFVVDSLAITVITPKLYFAGDTLLIPGEPLQVSTDYLGGYEYKWYRGDDLVADSLGKKAITIWQAGEYYLEIYRANKLVHTTRSFTVSIRSFALNLPAKIELFEKDEVKLEAAQHEQLIYKWQLDGQEKERGPGKNTIQIKGPGSYRLSVSRVAGNESYRIDSVEVIFTKPQLTILGDTLLIPGEELRAQVKSLPGYTYQWYKDEALLARTTNVLDIAQAGIYQVKTLKGNTELYASKKFQVAIRNFSLNLPPTVEIFKGDELQVKAPAHEQLQYEWLHNEAVVASGENLHQLTVKAAGEYKLAVGRKGVNDKFVVDSLAITVITPKLYFAGDTLLIPGEPLQVSTDYLGGYEYKWYRGDDLVADSLGKKAITIWQAGEYYLEIYRANKLVHTTRSFTVSIRSFALNLPAKIELFEKDEVKLEAAQHEQLIYKWQLDGQEKERGPGKNTIQIKGPGSYRLSVSRVAGNESYRIDSVEVIFTKPQLTILGDTLLIPGEELRAQVKSLPGYTYQWYKDEALLARTTNVLDIAQAGIYQVKTLKGNTELYASKKFQVAIRNFSLNLPPTVEIFKGDELQVKAPAHEQLQYEWLHNEAVVASGENLHQLTVKAAGEYKLAVGRKESSKDYSINSIKLETSSPNIPSNKKIHLPTGAIYPIDLKAYYNSSYALFSKNNLLQTYKNGQINIKESGIYKVNLIGNTSNIEFKNLEINFNDFIIEQIINIQEDSLVTLSAPLFNGNFEWYINGKLIKDSQHFGSRLSANSKGTYYAKFITNEDVSFLSNSIIITDLKDFFNLQINKNNIQIINKSDYNGEYSIKIYDLSGKELYESKGTKNSVKLELNIPINIGLSSSIYSLQFRTKTGVINKKFLYKRQ